MPDRPCDLPYGQPGPLPGARQLPAEVRLGGDTPGVRVLGVRVPGIRMLGVRVPGIRLAGARLPLAGPASAGRPLSNRGRRCRRLSPGLLITRANCP